MPSDFSGQLIAGCDALLAALIALDGQNPAPKQIDTIDLVFRVLGIAGSILAAFGVVVGYFLSRHFADRDRDLSMRERSLAAKEADRVKLRDVLYESLKWFEGRTQNRSIGIAVVRTSWDTHPEFHALWIEVLANQVIYLLAAQKPKERRHELENLRRMVDILIQKASLIDVHTRDILCETMANKANEQIDEGLPLTSDLKNNLQQWLKDLKCKCD
jgi:hypothetical protein